MLVRVQVSPVAPYHISEFAKGGFFCFLARSVLFGIYALPQAFNTSASEAKTGNLGTQRVA